MVGTAKTGIRLNPPMLIIVFLAAVAAGFVLANRGKSGEGVQCTMEAKICPDGTAVGRTGPACEFAPCPEGKGVTGDAPTREECAARGGLWQQWGLAPMEYCQIPVADANNRCTDGSQCSLGKCISDEGNIPGRCQPYRNVFGCLRFIENGRVDKGAICID